MPPRCLFSIMIDANRSSERELRRVVVTATDREALLVEWLNELIYLFDAESLFFTGFDITYLSDILLEANCYGEKVDPTVHGIKTGRESRYLSHVGDKRREWVPCPSPARHIIDMG